MWTVVLDPPKLRFVISDLKNSWREMSFQYLWQKIPRRYLISIRMDKRPYRWLSVMDSRISEPLKEPIHDPRPRPRGHLVRRLLFLVGMRDNSSVRNSPRPASCVLRERRGAKQREYHTQLYYCICFCCCFCSSESTNYLVLPTETRGLSTYYLTDVG